MATQSVRVYPTSYATSGVGKDWFGDVADLSAENGSVVTSDPNAADSDATKKITFSFASVPLSTAENTPRGFTVVAKIKQALGGGQDYTVTSAAVLNSQSQALGYNNITSTTLATESYGSSTTIPSGWMGTGDAANYEGLSENVSSDDLTGLTVELTFTPAASTTDAIQLDEVYIDIEYDTRPAEVASPIEYAYWRIGCTHMAMLDESTTPLSNIGTLGNADDNIGTATGIPTFRQDPLTADPDGRSIFLPGGGVNLKFGSGGGINEPLIQGDNPRSVSLWFKVDPSVVGSNTLLVGMGSADASNDDAFEIVLIDDASGGWYPVVVVRHNGSIGTSTSVDFDTATISPDTIHNLIITYNQTIIACYLDGTAHAISAGTTPGTLTTSAANQLAVGIGTLDSVISLVGNVDDLAVMPKALTQDEVDDIITAGEDDPAVVVPTANNDTLEVTRGSSRNVNVLANDFPGDFPIDITSVTISSAPSNGTINSTTNGIVNYEHSGGVDTSDSFQYTVKDIQGNTSAAATVTVTVNDVPAADPERPDGSEMVAAWTMGATTDSWADGLEDKAAPALTLTGEIESTTGPGNIPYAAVFDGTNDYLRAAGIASSNYNMHLLNTSAPGARANEPMTLEFVFRLDADLIGGSGDPNVLTPLFITDNNTEIDIYITGGGDIRVFFDDNAAGDVNLSIDNTANWDSTTWYQLIVTWDSGGNLEGYLYGDDTLLDSDTAAWAGTPESGADELNIGRRGAARFHGDIAAVRIWRLAMDANQRAWLNNSGSFRSNADCFLGYKRDQDAYGLSTAVANRLFAGDCDLTLFGDEIAQYDSGRMAMGIMTGWDRQWKGMFAKPFLDGSGFGSFIKLLSPSIGGGSATSWTENDEGNSAHTDRYRWFSASDKYFALPGGGYELSISDDLGAPGGELVKLAGYSNLANDAAIMGFRAVQSVYSIHPINTIFDNPTRFQFIHLADDAYSIIGDGSLFTIDIYNGSSNVETGTAMRPIDTNSGQPGLPTNLVVGYNSDYLQSPDKTADIDALMVISGQNGQDDIDTFVDTEDGKFMAVLGCSVHNSEPGLYLRVLAGTSWDIDHFTQSLNSAPASGDGDKQFLDTELRTHLQATDHGGPEVLDFMVHVAVESDNIGGADYEGYKAYAKLNMERIFERLRDADLGRYTLGSVIFFLPYFHCGGTSSDPVVARDIHEAWTEAAAELHAQDDRMGYISLYYLMNGYLMEGNNPVAEKWLEDNGWDSTGNFEFGGSGQDMTNFENGDWLDQSGEYTGLHIDNSTASNEVVIESFLAYLAWENAIKVAYDPEVVVGLRNRIDPIVGRRESMLGSRRVPV